MLKKIKSLFIVEEAPARVPGKEDKSRPVERGKDAEIIPGDSGTVSNASVDQFFKVLAEAMQKGDIEGYDYLEFRQAVKSLDKLESEEQKKFVTAFTLAQTMGAKKEALIGSIDHYLGILKNEEEKFQIALQKQMDDKVLSGQDEIQKVKDQIRDKEQSIANLKQEITSLQEKINKLENEVADAGTRVSTVKNSFSKAYDSLFQRITEDREKIEKYIK